MGLIPRSTSIKEPLGLLSSSWHGLFHSLEEGKKQHMWNFLNSALVVCYCLLFKEIQGCFNPSMDVGQISQDQLATPLITLNIFTKVVSIFCNAADLWPH